MAALQPPRFTGLAGSILLILAAIGYGAMQGNHVPMIFDTIRDARDAAANAAGFRIAAVTLAGQKHVSRAEILAAAGVTERASLAFLDVEAARARLKAIPWIAEATVRKLYPDRLQIAITERAAFALWQKDGRIGVIADDGTVLEPYLSRGFVTLPLFVGTGAATRADRKSTRLNSSH